MKILMIGDIVGRPGRTIVEQLLPKLRKEEDVDWVIANGENLAGGVGLDRKTVKQIMDAGVDVVTSGNHVFRKEEAFEMLKRNDSPILRPANYPPGTAGRGWRLFENALGQKLIVINLIGRMYFREDFDCPFRAVDQILDKEIRAEGIDISNVDAILVDFHAEATSEKMSMMHYLDGRVSAVLGTHTHVQTADEKIMPLGTAIISDVGMTGAGDSVLGVKKNIVIKQYLTQLPQKFVWKTSGPTFLSGVVIKTKNGSQKAISIKRVLLNLDN